MGNTINLLEMIGEVRTNLLGEILIAIVVNRSPINVLQIPIDFSH